MRIALILAVAATLPLCAQARIVGPGGDQNKCEDGMRKNVSISTNFNGQEKSLADARAAIDSKRKGLEQAAAKAGVELDPNSYNYSISMNNNYNNGTLVQNYNYNGSLNFTLQNEEVAKKLTDRLDEQKLQFNVNVNASKCRE